jgi:hypothetical protein
MLKNQSFWGRKRFLERSRSVSVLCGFLTYRTKEKLLFLSQKFFICEKKLHVWSREIFERAEKLILMLVNVAKYVFFLYTGGLYSQ